MDVRVGDILRMKKPHPAAYGVYRSAFRYGFQDQVQRRGREVMVPRLKCEKNIKKIIRKEEEDTL